MGDEWLLGHPTFPNGLVMLRERVDPLLLQVADARITFEIGARVRAKGLILHQNSRHRRSTRT
jgi:hypothetical protein